MTQVTLSNGQILNFPEGMSPEQIKTAIQQKFPVKNMNLDKPHAETKSPQLNEEPGKEPNKNNLYDMFQDFMQPKKVDESGQPMIETFIGRIPKDMPEFKIGSPENKEMFSEMADVAAGGPGMKLIASAPFKLTLKNITKKILENKNKEKLFHTNEYNKIWKMAEESGLNNVKVDKNEIGLKTIKKYSQEKYYAPLEKFLENPTLQNAQKAQSDLGKLINSPQLNKEVLTSGEQATKKTAERAQKHIKDMMFRDETGAVNDELKVAYNKVSESYGKNYKPYDIKAINQFTKGKLTKEQLIRKLKSGSFMAEKGSAHPEIGARDMVFDALKYLGVPTGIGAGMYGAGYLIKKLIGKE